MQLQYITSFLAFVVAGTTSAIPGAAAAANPETDLSTRATQLRWDAVRDGKVCRTDWSGVCYEHCVTEGTTKRCQRNTITSAIDGSGCGLFNSRCKCTCVVP
ncbi:hypothetical protein J1614_011003 [Plenodomus biglobosus]|nr:hypothetical protein J1614_011003 [Plenodomus biglobosus]